MGIASQGSPPAQSVSASRMYSAVTASSSGEDSISNRGVSAGSDPLFSASAKSFFVSILLAST